LDMQKYEVFGFSVQLTINFKENINLGQKTYDFLKQPSKIFWRTFTTTDDLNEFFQHEQIILIK